MNNYNNNVPNLSSSDRIKDKKAMVIMNSTQKNFRANNCISKNIKFYKNGKIKHVNSYDLKSSLARGNVFCRDCNEKGINCASFRKAKINTGNNILSEYWGGAFISGDGDPAVGQAGGFTVIESNISGNPGQNIKSNVINIPNNLNGNDITIDPNNKLFDNYFCGIFKNLDYSIEKTYIVMRSAIPIKKNNIGLFKSINTIPGSCDNEKNNTVRNNIIGMIGLGVDDIFAGRIINLCCIREQKLKNPNPTSPNVLDNIGIFDIYIELFAIKNKYLLNKLINFNTLFEDEKYNWGEFQNDFGLISLKSQSQNAAFWYPSIIQSIKIFQGTPKKKYNQTKFNQTEQNYMSCLENGTRNINLTLPYIKNKTLLKSYLEIFLIFL